jgi:hypothetical protein
MAGDEKITYHDEASPVGSNVSFRVLPTCGVVYAGVAGCGQIDRVLALFSPEDCQEPGDSKLELV